VDTRRIRMATVAIAVGAFAWLAAPTGTSAAADDDTTATGTDAETESETDAEASFAVQPGGPSGPGGRDYFIYTLRTGQAFGDVVSISNLGSEPATFAVYATDAFNTPDAGFALLKEEDTPVDVGTWIDLGVTQYTVDPGTRADIPFSLEVPDDATPGDHAGAIVAQQIPTSTDDEDGIGFDVRVRIAARVYVRVDGLLAPSMTVDDLRIDYDAPANPFATSTAKIRYVLRNTGNIRLSTTADLQLSGIAGLGTQTLPSRAIPELLPGSSIEIAETVHDVRPLVRLTASLEVTAPVDDVAVRRSVSTWAVPWLAIVVPAAIVLIWLASRKRRAKPDDVDEEPEHEPVGSAP
jgi:hypothetical protein